MPSRRRDGIEWLDIAGIAAIASPILVIAVAFAWPALKLSLDGKEYLDPAEHANYLRNLFELTSFVATTAVLITAVWAFAFTKSQIEEAKATRLAGLYATLEARWASEEMLKSKAEFGKMMSKYRDDMANRAAAAPVEPVADFADRYLNDLKNNQYSAYTRFMDMIDYLEYIGMLEVKELIDISGIDYLLGGIVIETWSIVSKHILAIRATERASNIANGLAQAPDAYFCLTALAEKFLARYRT
jgi:hypothetical protein